MKHIFLLRHAKSAWPKPASGEPGCDDRDRPLAPRGQQASERIGARMRADGLPIDLVLCSTARRAIETLDLVLQAFGRHLPILYEDELYLPGADALLARLQALPDDVRSVLLVAHNPDLQDLAMSLIGRGPTESRRSLAEKFPTAALARLDVETDRWAGVTSGTACLREFVRPRDLA